MGHTSKNSRPHQPFQRGCNLTRRSDPGRNVQTLCAGHVPPALISQQVVSQASLAKKKKLLRHLHHSRTTISLIVVSSLASLPTIPSSMQMSLIKSWSLVRKDVEVVGARRCRSRSGLFAVCRAAVKVDTSSLIRAKSGLCLRAAATP